MQSEGFRQWRKALGLSQKDAAEALGLKRRMVQYYEKGERDGEAVEIPLSVRLACFALTRGVTDYAGPPAGPLRDDRLRRRAKRLRDQEKTKTSQSDAPVSMDRTGTLAEESHMPTHSNAIDSAGQSVTRDAAE